jgi:hypothetical protein
MESKIEQLEFQKTEKLKTEKLMIFEKFKERYGQFRDSDLIRTFRKTLPFDEENLKKLSRAELKGSNYTLHILHYNEGMVEEKERVKKLDDFRKLSTYLYLSSNYIKVVEEDKTKLNHYFSIKAYNYFFSIYTKPLEFELYVKADAKGSYSNSNNKKLKTYFDITADVLQKKEPIKQNSVKILIFYVPSNVIYRDEKGIKEAVMDWISTIGIPRLLSFRSNDPNKPIERRDLRDSFIYEIFRNAILSNTYTLSLDIDKNSGQKDPFLKGLIDLAQNPTDPNTYSIIKPLFDKIEEKMVDIMLKKYQNYRHLFIGAKILVFIIDPAKQDNMQIVVVPGYHSIVIKSVYK